MPRPPLVIGTWGKINRHKVSAGVYVAEARYRDHDGVTRQAERTGPTAQKAEDALKAALLQRLTLSSDDITPDSMIAAVTAAWYAEEIAGQRATNTETWYSHAIAHIITPGIGGVRLREVSVARLDRFLKAVTTSRGPGAAKTTKTVLSGALGYAARQGAIDRNPLRDVATIKRAPREEVRVLDLDQLLDLRARMYANRQAVLRDLPEPIDFMLATGARIGETLAVRWFDLELDTHPARAVIRATVVNGTIQERPKSGTSRRRLELPEWAAESLRARHQVQRPNDLGLVFPSERGTPRDPSNLRRQWRELREAIGYDWVIPHTFRKSIATILEDPKLAAQQLGHASEQTTKTHYIPKTHEGPALGGALDAIGGSPTVTPRVRQATAGQRGKSRDTPGAVKAS